MARRFLDDIKADIDTIFVAEGGMRVETEHKPILLDIIDSLKQDEGGIYGLTTVPSVAVTATYSALTSIYEAQAGGDDFIIPDFAAGTVAAGTTAGFTYTVFASLSFEGSNNDQFDFTVLADGAPLGVGESVTGRGTGNGRPVPVNIRTGILSTPADTVFALAIKSPDGNSNINVLSGSLYIVIEPTNNP